LVINPPLSYRVVRKRGSRQSLSPRLLAGRGRTEVRVRGVFRHSFGTFSPAKTAGEKDSRCNEGARTVKEKSSRRAQNLWVGSTEGTENSAISVPLWWEALVDRRLRNHRIRQLLDQRDDRAVESVEDDFVHRLDQIELHLAADIRGDFVEIAFIL